MNFHVIRIDNEIKDAFLHMLPPECGSISDGDLLLGSISDENEPAGVLFAKLEAAGFELRFIYVSPVFRRQGAAKQMLSTFIRAMLYLSPTPPVYTMFTHEEDTFAFERLLEDSGCFFMEEREAVYIFSAADRKRSKAYQNLILKATEPVFFFETNPQVQRNFCKKMFAEGHACAQDLADGLYSRDLSVCSCNKENEITSAVFFQESIR